jgi:DNA-binding NarL/FixJ family response regulator
MSKKVLLADDHGIIRQGLRSLLEKQTDIEVVGEAADGRKAVALVQELAPDIVIMDITMPNLNGVDATRQITAAFPGIKVIALSIHSNKRFVADMLKAGASGYILKECLFDELIQSIQMVAGGNIYLSPRITGVIVDDYVDRLSPPRQPQQPTLTEREHKVLKMIAEGKSIKQIALALHLSVKTVELNRRQIMQKLNVQSIADLIKYAIREGLISLEE